MSPPRTFMVEATVNRMTAATLLGRLDVADDELVVRCRLVPVFRPRSVARSAITAVTVERRWAGTG